MLVAMVVQHESRARASHASHRGVPFGVEKQGGGNMNYSEGKTNKQTKHTGPADDVLVSVVKAAPDRLSTWVWLLWFCRNDASDFNKS